MDHDGHGSIGGFADYNQSGMLNGGNTWSNNQYFMSDGGGRFQWGGSKTFAQFKAAAHETGSISQSYPDTSGWLTLTLAYLSRDHAYGHHGTGRHRDARQRHRIVVTHRSCSVSST